DPPMQPRRVLIVDDHEAFREAASAMLTSLGCDVVGALDAGEEAAAAVSALQPDLVLVDLRLPGIDGVTVAEELACLPRPPDVILISSRDEAGLDPRVVAAPVRGFVAKRALNAAALGALIA
ncbi:MAG: response regulator, partial [Gaiella sp.]